VSRQSGTGREGHGVVEELWEKEYRKPRRIIRKRRIIMSPGGGKQLIIHYQDGLNLVGSATCEAINFWESSKA